MPQRTTRKLLDPGELHLPRQQHQGERHQDERDHLSGECLTPLPVPQRALPERWCLQGG